VTAPDPMDRLEELLADRALEWLDPADEAELRALAGDTLAARLAEYETAAAAALLALTPSEPLPPELWERLEIQAREHFADAEGIPSGPGATVRGQSWTSRPAYGWFAAAAALILALLAWLPQLTGHRALDAGVELQALLERAPSDLLRVAWTASEDPGAAGAGGEVVWSSSEQRGYMRFEGLAANDPARTQYQLWVFDKEQDERYPVDGGVFDVPAGGGAAVVSIDPKLAVDAPYLFSVTVEKPGGVVVSSRERLVLVAPVPED